MRKSPGEKRLRCLGSLRPPPSVPYAQSHRTLHIRPLWGELSFVVDRKDRKRATIVDVEPGGPKELFYAEIRALRKR